MSNLGLWGKNPCFTTFVLFSTFSCFTNLFNVLILFVRGSYCRSKRGHGEASILASCCQFEWYACPAENLHFYLMPGLHSPLGFFFPILVVGSSSSRAEPLLFLLTHRNSALISSCREQMQLPLSPRIFGCRSHSCSGPCVRLAVDFTHILGCFYSSHDFRMWL